MYIEIDGLNTYYEQEGEGESILFLHGFKGGVFSFKGVFSKLKENYKVTALNIWGFDNNLSDIPKRTFEVSDFSKNVLLFLQKLNITKTHIISHSFGARAAIYLAAEYPELVDKLILIDAAGIKPRRGIKYRFKVFKFKLVKFLVKLKLFKKSRLDKYGSKDYLSLPQNLRQTFKNVVNENLIKYIKKITSPTLIIWGKRDADTPLYMAKKLNKNIKNSGLVVFDAGHYSYLEKFNELMVTVKYFLTH